MIQTMKAHKGQQLKTDFLLSDDVYAKANIQATDNVYLWLGVIILMIIFFYFLVVKINILIVYRLMLCWSIILKMLQNLFQEIYGWL